MRQPGTASLTWNRIEHRLLSETFPGVSATRRTIAGDVVSTWTRTPTGITLDLTVPVNVTAVVKGYGEVGSGRHHIRLNSPDSEWRPTSLGFHSSILPLYAGCQGHGSACVRRAHCSHCWTMALTRFGSDVARLCISVRSFSMS